MAADDDLMGVEWASTAAFSSEEHILLCCDCVLCLFMSLAEMQGVFC